MNDAQRALCFLSLAGLAAAAWADDPPTPRLTYLGRSTVKIVSSTGFTVWIDPYAPGDYSSPADLLLVTHGHADHNRASLVKMRPGAVAAAPAGALSIPGARVVAEGDSFTAGPVSVRVVPAYNANHPRGLGVGYLITVDGVSVYHSGDTSLIPEMSALAAQKVDYALFPVDGYYNMDAAEALACAAAVKPRFAMAIHSSPGSPYDEAKAKAFSSAVTLPLPPGKTIALEAAPKE